jgi:hypothetical protein
MRVCTANSYYVWMNATIAIAIGTYLQVCISKTWAHDDVKGHCSSSSCTRCEGCIKRVHFIILRSKLQLKKLWDFGSGTSWKVLVQLESLINPRWIGMCIGGYLSKWILEVLKWVPTTKFSSLSLLLFPPLKPGPLFKLVDSLLVDIFYYAWHFKLAN